MAQENSPTTKTSRRRPWSAETVYFVLSDPFRCRVIGSLSGTAKTAPELYGGLGVTRQACAKHLMILRKAGILVQKKNAKSVRHPLFELSPNAIVSKTEDGILVDLGACVPKFLTK